MKIAFLSPFYPYRGGIAQFSDNLFETLKNKCEVKAFTFKRLYPKIFFPGTSQYVPDADSAKDFSAPRVLDSINPFSYNNSAKKISANNPDLLLLSYWMPFFAMPLGRVSSLVKRKGTKVIAIMHNVMPHEGRAGDKSLSNYFFRKCDGFVVLNKKASQELEQINPLAKHIQHPHPIYNHFGRTLTQADARSKLKIPLSKKVILFFGLIRDYKGLDVLIKAMKELGGEYVLLVAGEVYGDFGKYEKVINENSLQDRVIIHAKYIPDNEVPVYFSAADVCVLPYTTASQSGITGMAYHFEVPLIVSKAGGLSETVEEDKTGIVIQELSPTVLSGAIRKFFENNLKAGFQENMRRYKSKYSWDSLADAIVKFYNTLQ
jgi:glycosyltransferase involved in cell wall biosynthesis